MKHCQKCFQQYDDTENFCQNDGSVLAMIDSNPVAYSSADTPTVVIRNTDLTDKKNFAKQTVHPIFAYLAIGIFALLAGGAIVFWLKSENNPSLSKQGNSAITAPPTAGTENMSGTDVSNADLINKRGKSEPKKQNSITVQNKLEPRKDEVTIPKQTLASRSSSGTWFIILGSYPKNDPEKANRRLQYVQGFGYNAAIIDTDNYSGFRRGLYSVVIGPTSKSEARSQLTQIKSTVSDAYIKSGW